jgi:hypothetical protein
MPLHMAWYTPTSWRRLQEVTEAPLAGSYDAYVALTEEMIREFEDKHGILVVKTLIDVDDMAAWCRKNGYRINARGRAAYGAMVAAWRGRDNQTDTGHA